MVRRTTLQSSVRAQSLLVLVWALWGIAEGQGGDGGYLTVNSESSVEESYQPAFTQHPEPIYFVFKNRPANVTCRARNADQLVILCSSELARNVTVVRLGGPDGELQAWTIVSFNDVVELFAEYSCRCNASRNISAVAPPLDADPRPARRQRKPADIVTVQSNAALVQEAKIDKNFHQEPIDTTAVLDTPSIVLHCRSPDGNPIPEVYWLRDGKQIDPHADTNFVVSNDGSLILSRTREFDSGLYVCVAQNIAGTRRTQPARLTVVVNGGWSQWMNWQSCTNKCGPGTQKRIRECTNPKARNGGKECEGPSEEKRNCTGTKCGSKTDEWSDWSDWSECLDCVQTRRRTCKDRFNRLCTFKVEEQVSQNCCEQRERGDSLQSTEKPTETAFPLVPVVISAAVVLLLVIGGIIVLVVIRRMRARTRMRLYGNEDDSTRCLKLGKSCANKNQRAEPNSIDIVMNPTAQLIGNSEYMQYPYIRAANGVQESHLVFMPGNSAPTALLGASHVDAAAQGDAPYFVPFVGAQMQKHATATLPNAAEQPANFGAARTVQYSVQGGVVPFSSSSQPSTSATPPTPFGTGSTQQTAPSAPQPPAVLYDPSETATGVTGMRLPPSIAIPPPPPAARPLVQQPSFKLSLRPTANGTELTLAGSCHDTYARSSECRTDATFSELSSVRSETEAEMSEFCDAQLGLLSSTNTPFNKDLELDRVASPNLVCCASVDRREGCTLCIDHANISLVVPEMAFELPKLDLLVTVLREECEQPKLTNRETLLSPIVQIDCAYADSRDVAIRPCVLSIPHCAILTTSDSQRTWRFSVYHCANDNRKDSGDWQPVAILDQNGSIVMCSASVSCQIDSRLCHILTARFGKYCLVGESASQCNAVKSLQLAAFARNLTNSLDHKLRVYAIEDHPDALDTVIDMETRLGGNLLDPPKRMLFVDSGENLCVSVDQINSNWKIRTDGCYQEIPFRHIWSSREKLHCSFSFESGPRGASLSEYFQCTITVYQKNMFTERERLHISQPSNRSHSGSSERFGSNSQAIIHTPNNSNTSGVASCSCIVDGVVVPAHCGLTKQSRLISAEARAKLCSLLDDCNGYRADWRTLGQQLEVQQCVLNMVAGSVSPTSMLLTMFEAQARQNEQALQNLYTLFRSLGRNDCAAVLEAEVLAHVSGTMIS